MYDKVFLYTSHCIVTLHTFCILHTVLLHFTLWGVVGRLGSGLGLKPV